MSGFEHDEERREGKKYDHRNNEDRAHHRMIQRAKMLEVLAPAMTCKRCARVYDGIRHFIVNKRKTRAVCRSCFAQIRAQRENTGAITYDIQDIFPKIEVRVTIRGDRLRGVRKQLGESLRDFGDRFGVSAATIYNIEQQRQKTLDARLAAKIEKLLRGVKFRLPDSRPVEERRVLRAFIVRDLKDPGSVGFDTEITT